MEQIQPWGNKGMSLGNTAIMWKLDWMQTFLNGVKNRGGRFDKPIWVTEMGITSGSYPSQAQVKSFMMNTLSWLDSQSYVERVVWFGCFTASNPPDGFATGLNTLIKSGLQHGLLVWVQLRSTSIRPKASTWQSAITWKEKCEHNEIT
ncbi:glycoside hydrolase family 128 protein [Laccaria amethystina LaAM-08-1]|uniref:Glycoside hydrolase family 128 protein n=1 Tax=Laccaria amethystina LaAM-08-1 TaxID=1095629 RepID=A0A0C9WGM5_9AGAR|nr:glycoside hydrolase family 128 protein [Laccaria amethystina LaAM-08-1]